MIPELIINEISPLKAGHQRWGGSHIARAGKLLRPRKILDLILDVPMRSTAVLRFDEHKPFG
jgi:hypothetical protein